MQHPSAFFYPISFLMPGFDGEALEHPPFHLVRRKWETSTFDMATLATRHKLHLPYQAMDVFLSRCNMELAIFGKATIEEANKVFQILRVALYSSGISPFTCPFVTTYSINDYSGINSRDSEFLRSKLHPGMQQGLTSDAGVLEAWPFELSFQCSVDSERLTVTESALRTAALKVSVWTKLLTRFHHLQAVIDAAIAAPTLGNMGQSLLHIWTGLEGLFPSVSTEVTFRIALYIAQLTEGEASRLERYNSVRAAYAVRSKVAHGARSTVTPEEWHQAWQLLMDCLNAVHRRECLPTEQELLNELLVQQR